MIELGVYIIKEFIDGSGKSQGLFRGHIVNINDDDSNNVLYHVLCENVDAEDMNEVECRNTIILYMKIESGDINEMNASEKVDYGI